MTTEEVIVKEFEIFKDAMREENLAVQIEITKKLASLAQLLGEETTREELLPFIQENIDFHDEILLNLSEQLKQFIPLVGGYQHSKTVLDLLVKLCNTDETIVRDKTVETLKTIGVNLSNEQAEELFLPVIEKLTKEEWFTSKCSAAALYATCYPKVSGAKKAELRTSFRILIQDDSPMVRKSAATACIDFIDCLEPQFIKSEFVPVFDNIAQDAMDSVRVVAVDIAIAIAKKLPQNEIEEFILKTIESWCEDSSWRLRQRLAFRIADIQKVVPFAKTRGRILAIYQKLVKDSEAEVRGIAAKNLYAYSDSLLETYRSQPQYENNFEPVFEGSIMPQVHNLLCDESDGVRQALSLNVLSLSGLISNACFKRNILPLLIEVLEHEISMPFQANMLQNLNYLPRNISLTDLLPSVKKNIQSIIVNSQTHWRTRRSILIAFMHVAKFSSKEYFCDNLKIFYAALLGDSIFAIRRTAPLILPLLAKQYGIKWASENLIPYFMMFTKDCRYLYRYVPLFGINELVEPSICHINAKDQKYLSDIKALIENKETKDKALRILGKLNKLLNKLDEKLKKQEYVDMLQLNEELNTYKCDDINLYAGETLEVLQKEYNIDVYAIKVDNNKKDSCTYLEGVLCLIHRDFLSVIERLYKDPIENVQIRAIYTLNTITEFVSRLKKEFQEPWVEECLKKISSDILKEIEEEIEEELKQKILEVEEEKIDTELMETMSEKPLPDLGAEIPELENCDHTLKNKEKSYTTVENRNKVEVSQVRITDEDQNKKEDKHSRGETSTKDLEMETDGEYNKEEKQDSLEKEVMDLLDKKMLNL